MVPSSLSLMISYNFSPKLSVGVTREDSDLTNNWHYFSAELSVGMTTEGIDVRSVGNSLTLHETALVEAFNLKAAIEYQLKNCESFNFVIWQWHINAVF